MICCSKKYLRPCTSNCYEHNEVKPYTNFFWHATRNNETYTTDQSECKTSHANCIAVVQYQVILPNVMTSSHQESQKQQIVHMFCIKATTRRIAYALFHIEPTRIHPQARIQRICQGPPNRLRSASKPCLQSSQVPSAAYISFNIMIPFKFPVPTPSLTSRSLTLRLNCTPACKHSAANAALPN